MKKGKLKPLPNLTPEEVDLVMENINASGGLVRKKSIYQSMNATSDVQVVPTDNYEGKYVQEVIRYLYVDNSLVKNGLVTQFDGIKLKEHHYVGRVPLKMGDRPADGKFVGDGLDISIVPFVLAPVLYRFEREISHLKLLESGFSESFEQGALNDNIMPQEILSFILEEIYEKMPIENERLYLTGKGRVPTMQFTGAYLGFEDRLIASTAKKIIAPNTPITAITNVGGFLAFTVGAGLGVNFQVGDLIEARGIADGSGGNLATKINSQVFNLLPYSEETTENVAIRSIAGDVLQTNIGITANGIVIGTPVVTNAKLFYINNSNIVDSILAVWNAIPRAVKSSGEVNIWVHDFAWDKWQITQGERLGGDFVSEKVKQVMGLPIFPISTMSPNTIIAITPKNAIIGFDDISDEANLWFKNMFETTGDMLYRFLLDQRTCTHVPKPSEAVILAPM